MPQHHTEADFLVMASPEVPPPVTMEAQTTLILTWLTMLPRLPTGPVTLCKTLPGLKGGLLLKWHIRDIHTLLLTGTSYMLDGILVQFGYHPRERPMDMNMHFSALGVLPVSLHAILVCHVTVPVSVPDAVFVWNAETAFAVRIVISSHAFALPLNIVKRTAVVNSSEYVRRNVEDATMTTSAALMSDVVTYVSVLTVIDVLCIVPAVINLRVAAPDAPALSAETAEVVMVHLVPEVHASAAMVVRVAASTVPVEFVCSVQDVAQMAAKEDLASAV